MEKANMIPIDFEILLKIILGDEKYLLSEDFEYTSPKEYKAQIISLLDTIDYAIIQTIKFADNCLLDDINDAIIRGKSSLKNELTIEQIATSAISIFVELLFLLIGNIPKNSNSRKHKKIKYTLNDFRTISYIQSNQQKLNLIIFSINNSPENFISEKDRNIIISEFRNLNYNPDKCISWFKKIYPNLYLKFF